MEEKNPRGGDSGSKPRGSSRDGDRDPRGSGNSRDGGKNPRGGDMGSMTVQTTSRFGAGVSGNDRMTVQTTSRFGAGASGSGSNPRGNSRDGGKKSQRK